MTLFRCTCAVTATSARLENLARWVQVIRRKMLKFIGREGLGQKRRSRKKQVSTETSGARKFRLAEREKFRLKKWKEKFLPVALLILTYSAVRRLASA